MITKKKLKEEIITYDIITYKDDDGKDIEYVEVTLVDSAMAITEYLARYIGSESDKQQGSSTFYVSDNEEKFTQIAERILNDNIKKLIRVRLYESWFQN